MFHDGDLTSGISLAISQSKVVAILVRTPDESEAAEAYDSRIWEEYWLQNLDTPWDELSGPPFGEQVREKAVLLRVDSGSKEANFLAAFCPVTVVPALVIIKDGTVLDKIERGVSREEFIQRTTAAVGLRAADQTPQASPHQQEQTGAPRQQAETADVQHDSGVAVASQLSEPPDESHAARVTSALQERSRRLAQDHAARAAAEKAERVERAKARRKEAERAAAHESPASQSATSATDDARARRDWLHQQNQRKQEAKIERERILRQIELDKQERKARGQRAQTPSSPSNGSEGILRTSGAAATASSISNNGGMCSLQIRLFDGSSIRSRFPPEATLASHVRDWIAEKTNDESGQADGPFTFKHVVAPQPSRSIETSEEHKSLEELSFTPNATLVLVPVFGASDAYALSTRRSILGYLYRAAMALIWFVTQFLPAASKTPTQPNGDHTDAQSRAPGLATGNSQHATSSTRVNTLSDQQDGPPSEFYNGNSLGFEGRDDGHDDSQR